jgi:sec-independent protein translocase protein TatA
MEPRATPGVPDDEDEMLNIGPQELLLILLVALVVVGPRKLPELGRSIGKGLRELRKAQDEVRKTIQVNMDEERAAQARPPAAPPGASSAGDREVPGAADPGAVSGSDVAAAAASGASEVSEVSRSLGRGIAELRRARKDIQRTFRVDLTEPRPQRPAERPGAATRPSSGASAPASSTPTASPPASSTSANDAQDAGTPQDVSGDPTGSPPE